MSMGDGTRIHVCVSVDVDRFDDKYLRSSGILDMFRDSLGCKTPRDVRQHCEMARRKGYRVFPSSDCDNQKPDGSCGGHSTGEEQDPGRPDAGTPGSRA